jgi:glycosyltransferase involved in cell wall biosynthesis
MYQSYTKFSIIIPVYNVEQYVGYCLKSICDQDFDRNLFEIILVDDCSPDASCDVIEQIMGEYPDTRIKLIHHDENKHIGGARNTGLRAAEGEYILWVDSDDCFVYKSTLSTLSDVLSDTDIDVLRTKNYTQIVADYFAPLSASKSNFDIKSYSSHEYMNLPYVGLHAHSSVYKRKFLLDNNIIFRERHSYEDSDWSYFVNYKAKKIYEIDFPFYGYRCRADSITNDMNVKTFMDNAISVVESDKVVATKIADPIIQKDIRQWIKFSLYLFIKISRFYPLKDSKKCISYAYRNVNISSSKYITSVKDFFILNTVRYCPMLVVLPIRLLYRLKCALRKIKG